MSQDNDRAIRRATFHYVIQAFAQAAGGIFMLAFLLKAGVSVQMALLFQAGVVGGRYLIRPAVLPLAIRFGVRPLLIAGTLLTAATYLLIGQIQGPGWPLVALCAFSSLGYLLYWLCFHAYFAALGDPDRRGGQVGLREAIVAGAGVLAPLLGAWGLTTLGGPATFAMVAAIMASAALPLIGAPEVAVNADTPQRYRVPKIALWLMVGDGFMAAGFHFTWLIALFVSLGESFTAFGGAAAAAALTGAVGGLVLGRAVDSGHGQRAVALAYGCVAIIVVARASSLDAPWLAVLANAAGGLLTAIVTPVLMTPVYNLSKASRCTLRFHVATEGAWDLGCLAGCLGAAGLVALGLPLSVPILTALLAAAGLVVLLFRYYGRRPA
jgi:hypothetical protein